MMYKTLAFLLQFYIAVLPLSTILGQETDRVIAMSLLNENVLFVGVDNPVAIVARQNNPVMIDDIRLSHGKIRETERGFILNFEKSEDVWISIKTAFGEVKEHFKVYPINHVIASLGGRMHDSEIPLDAFIKNRGIASVINCCGFDAQCETVSYVITRINKAKEVFRTENKGAFFTKEAQEIIQTASTGDTFIFSKIQAKCPGDDSYFEPDMPRYLSSLIIEIK